MKVKFYPLNEINNEQKDMFLSALKVFLEKGCYVLGEELRRFEDNYASFCGVNYSIGTGNGFDALKISLMALGISHRDEVIVPANTYIATWLAVSSVGAVPIPVEPTMDSMNIDTAQIVQKITKKTKAIIPVHLFGLPCEMDDIMKIADAYNIKVVEDAAQSQGAMYKGKACGSFGHINATSFYPSKNLGALGDGGCITTNDKELYDKCLMLRNYGSPKKYYNNYLGLNSRLDELQAYFLNIQLKQLKKNNTQRIQVAQRYLLELGNISEITVPEITASVVHQFVIRTKERNQLKEYLLSKGIETVIHYPIPPHLQKAYSFMNYKKGDFPITEKIADTCLSLPMHPLLKKEEVNFICETIKEFFY